MADCEKTTDFYALSDADKARRLRPLVERALGLWNMTGASYSLIKMRENAVFGLVLRDGSRAVMRVHRAEYHTDDELRSELEWMRALDAYGVHTPAVIPAADGNLFKVVADPQVPEPRQVDVLAWVAGTKSGTIEHGVGELEQAISNYRLVGQLLARMHDFYDQWDAPPGFTRHAWDVEGLLGEQPWWGRFWESTLLDEQQRGRLLLAREQARADLESYGRGADRYGLIHADPLPENILVGDDDTAHVIDFDDGGYGWHLFDFATALFFVLGEGHFDDLCAALFEGYEQVRPLPPETNAMLPLFLLLRGFTYLGWVHSRTAKQLGPALVVGLMSLVEEYLSSRKSPEDA
jgi:Ser/Thr protein kinase RdoA (MazF antagonist)